MSIRCEGSRFSWEREHDSLSDLVKGQRQVKWATHQKLSAEHADLRRMGNGAERWSIGMVARDRACTLCSITWLTEKREALRPILKTLL
jgi:hypothetical protein